MGDNGTAQDKLDAIVRRTRDREASREKALANLQWSGQLGKAEKQVLWHLTKAYGLDPALREVVVLGGNAYVTISGLIRTAERTGKYAGCRYEELPPLEEGERRYRCTVSKVVDGALCGFEGLGRANPRNVAMKTTREMWLDELAQKRALARALRAAFPISIPCWEEAQEYGTAMAQTVSPDLIAEVVDEVGRDPGEEG